MKNKDTLRVALLFDRLCRVDFTNPEQSPITREYRRFFGTRLDMFYVSAEGLRTGSVFHFNPHILIIPGIFGEVSYYREHFGDKGRNNIRNYVQNGGVLDLYCAGAYEGGLTTQYNATTGEYKTKTQEQNLAVAPVHSYGPVGGYCVGAEIDRGMFTEGLHRVDAVPVVLAETNQRVRMAYGFGPAFRIAEGSNAKVLARYSEIEGNPASIVESCFGRGLVRQNGTLPSITYLDACMYDNREMHAAQKRLAQHLYKYREPLQAFADTCFTRMEAHHRLTLS